MSTTRAPARPAPGPAGLAHTASPTATPPYLDGLNDAQRRAVLAPDGAALVIAGAGSGKTKTLACRVAALISRGVPPARILLLTFTRRAAAEMLARAARLTTASASAAGRGSASASGAVWGGTFHATANRLLRLHGHALGLPPSFTVIDHADAQDLFALVRSDLSLDHAKSRFPRKGTLAAVYSRCVNAREKLADVLVRQFPWVKEHHDGLKAVFEQYTQRKREQHVLDYDDLLLYWHALMHSPAAPEVAGRFDHVLVDEYQDTNLIQAELLQQMIRHQPNANVCNDGTAGPSRGIMVVGDDAQSIYSFRAATVRNILDFPKHFTGCTVITLEQNYRSVGPILAASNAVMAQATERFTKDLFSTRGGQQKPMITTCVDEAEQCEQVCGRILALREAGVDLRRQAVLFRAAHHSDALEVELTRRNIPFVKYGGIKFVEAAHVKDLVAMLRILENPTDRLSWHRVLLLLAGVGPATARALAASLGTSPLRMLLDAPPAVPPAARDEFDSLRAALRDCADAPGVEHSAVPPASQVERLRKFYEPLLPRLYDNPTSRQRDLEQLEQIAGGYRSRASFITDLTLDPPSSTQDLAGPPLLDEDWITLSTIHSAKGCEWDAVHLIHVADGMMPSDMATGNADEIDEERRLMYVATTRARDTLDLYFPLRYYHRARGKRSDRHSYAQLSRFLPPAVRDPVDRATAPRAAQLNSPATAPAPTPGSPALVDNLLKSLWS